MTRTRSENNISPQFQIFLQLACEFDNSDYLRGNSVIYNLFTCDVNFPVWPPYLWCQCDVIKIKNFYEILRYLFQILTTVLKILLNLARVLIYSLTKCIVEDGFKDSCSVNFAIFVEKYLWPSILFGKVFYVELQFFKQSAPPNVFFTNLRNIHLN